MAFFKMMNRIGLLQGQADIIEPIDHAVLAKAVDLEVQQLAAVGSGHGLLRKIDHELVPGEGFDFIK